MKGSRGSSVRSIFGILAALSLAETATAVDVPIDAELLKLRDTESGTVVTFLSRDPDVPFPAPGSAEDPTTASGRLSLDLFTQSRLPIHVELPTAVGMPGWRFVDGKIDRYLFQNGGAPDAFSSLRRVLVRQGRVLQATGFFSGPPPLGASAVRIQTGANRVCAAFLPSEVRRDDSERYLARGAVAASLGDCSDAAIAAAIQGRTPTPSPSPRWTPSPQPTLMPCGGSPELPQCNGDCPAGEICGATLYPEPSCGCVPASVPCEDATWPTCGGTCPEGGICSIEYPYASCRCIFASDPCGATFPRCGGECPAGEECSPRESGPLEADCTCAPVGVKPCGQLGGVGGFPACEQECPDAENSCQPLLYMSGPGCTVYEYCGCVPPGPCGQPEYSPGTCPPGLMCVAWRGYWYCSDGAPNCV